MLFRDRREAGRLLAGRLASRGGWPDAVVLALPRGGVPVAAEVAMALGAPLDVFLVRKLGVPSQPELAMGAIASGGLRVIDPGVLAACGVSPAELEAVTVSELRELERRERAYRGGAPPLAVRGKTAVLVDDGIATGSSIRAALAALRRMGPARVVVAVPVAPPSTLRELEDLADEVVCVAAPRSFRAVGEFYQDFEQTTDAEVRRLLWRAAPAQEGVRGPPGGRPADKGGEMENRLVPRADWIRFFEEFSRRHQGWLATVRVVDSRIGSQVEARDLPLEGIVVDPEGRGTISIWLGSGPGANVEHPVEQPAQVWVEVTEQGAEAALEIESAGGRKTILEFRAAVLPEAVDGLANETRGNRG